MDPHSSNATAFWDRCFSDPNVDYKSLAKGDWSKTLGRLRDAKARTVLDLGCGYGHWSIVMARAGLTVTAIDISPVALGILNNWSAEEGLAIETIPCSAPEAGSLNRTFDAVICNSVIDHLPVVDAEKTLAGIHGLLAPGGIAYVSFDGLEEDDPKEYQVLADGTRDYIKGKYDGMLWRYYTDIELKALLAGFDILHWSARKNGKRDIWIVNEKPR